MTSREPTHVAGLRVSSPTAQCRDGDESGHVFRQLAPANLVARARTVSTSSRRGQDVLGFDYDDDHAWPAREASKRWTGLIGFAWSARETAEARRALCKIIGRK